MVRVTKIDRKSYNGVKSLFVSKPSEQTYETEYIIEGPTSGDAGVLLREIFAHEQKMQYKKLKAAEKRAQKKAKRRNKNG